MNKRVKMKKLSGLAVVMLIGTFIGTGDIYMWALNKLVLD
jgi:hypothetical protein